MPRLLPPRTIAITFIATLLLSACGGDGNTSTTVKTITSETSDATSSIVALKDFEIEPEFTSISAGAIIFEVVNRGALDHEFIIVRTDTDFDKLPINSAVVPLNSASFNGVILRNTKILKSQEMESFKVALEPGRYVLLCNIPGHYELGMRISLMVQ